MKVMRILSIVAAVMLSAVACSAQGSYEIRAGDSLTIEVLEDSSLNRTVQVLPDGNFSFPFAGTVRATGRTVGQIESAVRSAIAPNFAVEPTVFVTATPAERTEAPIAPETAAPTINIFFVGEVGAPGIKALPPGTTFLQSIAASGGFSNFAATKRVQLRRTDRRTGRVSTYIMNYKALSDGAQLLRDITLVDGDVIVVPERRLFE